MRFVHSGRPLPTSGRRFLTVPEVAKALGISTGAAWKRLYRGLLPYRRLSSKRIGIPVDELEQFLSALPGRTAAQALKAVQDRLR